MSHSLTADLTTQVLGFATSARVGPGVCVPVTGNGGIGHDCPSTRACAVAALARRYAGACAIPSIFTVSFVVKADVDGRRRGGEGEDDGRVENVGPAEGILRKSLAVEWRVIGYS
jgi:hypothetical protein